MADYTWHSRRDRKTLWDRIVCSVTFFSAVCQSNLSHPSPVLNNFICVELALVFFFSRANSLEKCTNQFSIAVNRKVVYILEFFYFSGGKCLDQEGKGLVGD